MDCLLDNQVAQWLESGQEAIEINDRSLAYHCMTKILELLYSDGRDLEGPALDFYLILLGSDALLAQLQDNLPIDIDDKLI